MKYQVDDYEATHPMPIWGDRSDFIFVAHLGIRDGKNEWEQLWGRKTGQQQFVLCCIPFFSYDIALGDVVETDGNFVLQRVIRGGGQKTFRIWFSGQDEAARTLVEKEIAAMGSFMEWSSKNLLAISVPESIDVQMVRDYLQAHEDKGRLQYDTGCTV